MAIAIGTIATPALKTKPSATATPAMSRTKTASIRKVRRLLRAICSYMPMTGRFLRRSAGPAATIRWRSELDRDRTLLAGVALEGLARREVAHPRDEVARERLDPVVVAQHGVVVELPRVGDLVLGRGQLLLQVQEVLVGLEVRIRLGHREQALQRPAQLVLGLGLGLR